MGGTVNDYLRRYAAILLNSVAIIVLARGLII